MLNLQNTRKVILLSLTVLAACLTLSDSGFASEQVVEQLVEQVPEIKNVNVNATAELTIVSNIHIGASYQLIAFDDAQTCSNPKNLDDNLNDRSGKRTEKKLKIAAGRLTSYMVRTSLLTRFCDVVGSFMPKENRAYLLNARSEVGKCAINMLDVTNKQRPKLESSFVPRKLSIWTNKCTPLSDDVLATMARLDPVAVTAAPVIQIVPAPDQSALVPPPLPSGFADLNDESKLESLGRNLKKGYHEFLSNPLPRAFAFTEDGHWFNSWGTKPKTPGAPTQPYLRIITDCENLHQRICYLYAVDNAVVYKPVPSQ